MATNQITKVLVANRGEIACRVFDTWSARSPSSACSQPASHPPPAAGAVP